MDQNIISILSLPDHTPFLLSDRSNWASWYKRIRLVALSMGIWPYINPNAKEPLTVPEEPQRPVYGDFQSGAQRYSSLEDRNRMDYDQAVATWRWEYEDWRRLRGNVAGVALLITSSVSKFAFDMIVDEDEPRVMLGKLKGHFESDY